MIWVTVAVAVLFGCVAWAAFMAAHQRCPKCGHPTLTYEPCGWKQSVMIERCRSCDHEAIV